MAGFDRTLIIKGPALITFNSASILSEDDIEVDFKHITFDVKSSGFGRVDVRARDKQIVVRFKPSMWDNLAVLLPYSSSQIGAPLYGATDLPLVINPLTGNGAKLTLVNAAITKLPTLKFSARNSLLGPIEFTGLVGNSLAAAAATSYFAFGTASGTLAALDLTKIKNEVYTLVRSAATFQSLDGFDFEPDLQLVDDDPDGFGVVNKRISGFSGKISFTPANKVEADLATLLAFGIEIGATPGSADSVIAGATVSFTLNKTVPVSAQTGYGPLKNRLGQIVLEATRSQTAGVLDALFTAA